MNHKELKNLINKLNNISIKLNNKISQLHKLQMIREATRNTGTRPTPEYTTYQMNYNRSAPNGNPTQPEKKNTMEKRLKVGDNVEVVRGRNQGVKAGIIKETPAQFEVRSDQVQETFCKWKNNIRKLKN